jgi:hypothetical protein
MTKATADRRLEIEEETERLRQLVIASRDSATVGPAADECFDKLRKLHASDPTLFSVEDARWLNVLCGTLGRRIAALTPKKPAPTRLAKRKGDQLDHCWRCETPVDERFTEICPTCDSKAYHWRVCPICRACGCQRSGNALV